MGNSKIRNVFISHIHKDDDGLGDLKSLLGKKGMEARDYSITKDKFNQAKSEEYIKSSILGPKIKQCSTLVVYISPQTKDSDWVNWEIEYAAKKGLNIVGVWENGSKGCEIPEALDKYADAIVGWNGDRIIDAIEGRFSGRENADGTENNSKQSMTHHPCG